MGITIFFLLSSAAMIFLFYVLANFIEDSRRREPAMQQLVRESCVQEGSVRGSKIILFRQVPAQR